MMTYDMMTYDVMTYVNGVNPYKYVVAVRMRNMVQNSFVCKLQLYYNFIIGNFQVF